jgi:hypothetical protein
MMADTNDHEQTCWGEVARSVTNRSGPAFGETPDQLPLRLRPEEFVAADLRPWAGPAFREESLRLSNRRGRGFFLGASVLLFWELAGTGGGNYGESGLVAMLRRGEHPRQG